MRRFRILGLLVALTVAACGGDDGGGDEAVVDDVTVAEAIDLADDDLVIIDVRTPEEFAAGHLEGAVNLSVEDPAFRDRVRELDRDRDYLVYCRTGNRSAQASAIMAELGFTGVRNVTGGGFGELAAGGARVGQ